MSLPCMVIAGRVSAGASWGSHDLTRGSHELSVFRDHSQYNRSVNLKISSDNKVIL